MNELVPIENSWVCRKDTPNQIGRVTAVSNTRETSSIHVDFGPAGSAVLHEGEWGCGLRPGFVVQDVPLSNVRETLGAGTVRQVRELGLRFQALIQLHNTGTSVWLPFERLRRVMDPALRYRRSEVDGNDAAERLALKVLGHALRTWNEATGALDRLDVDPLPHQIGLVHRIINSGQSNWLIADDVGLGKTIEIGLLMAALERRKNVRRILLVVPSGLTRQWKEEMLHKFDRRFLIYGTDFRVHDEDEWGLYERVIISLDLAKPRNSDDLGDDTLTSFGMLLAAGSWDLIVFDEAHRLARDERGRSTHRYRLAQALRQKTEALLLLTGTPHQGDAGKFRNLLSLVRPDLRSAIEQIDETPEVTREIVLRTRKIDAVDLEGNFLFKGLIVKRIAVETDPEFATLERQLTEYLRRGYGAGDRLGGPEGRAVGFVMTIYRKLASSSVAALWIALQNRLARISGTAQIGQQSQDDVRGHELDANNFDVETDVEDDIAERPIEANAQPFFENEEALLRDLISKGAECMRNDRKGAALLQIVRDLVEVENKKVLIFTEYRSTQAYLIATLQKELGQPPAIIHGGQTSDEKRDAVDFFETSAPILISTEAGGEGLNLHRQCHVMINYDLPWNPARITQRIGRLYRYGQQHKVVVINFHAQDTIDNDIISTLLDRVGLIVKEMASVGPEFDELYASDVMGELLERVDISSLLEEARNGRIDRTQERIDAAIADANRARIVQDEVLNQLDRFDPNEVRSLGALTSAHLARFIKRAAPFMEIMVEESADEERFTLRLPPNLKGIFSEFGGRTVVPTTTRRDGGAKQRAEVLLDFSTSFVSTLVTNVTTEGFGGSYAAIDSDDVDLNFFAAFLARFQDDQGNSQGEKLLIVGKDSSGSISIKNDVVDILFEKSQIDASPLKHDTSQRKAQFDAARDRAELAMASELNRFRHPNDLVTLSVAELTKDTPDVN